MNVTSLLRPIGGDDIDCLVFGLSWEPIIGARPERESLDRAKAAKATHLIPASENSTVVGFTRLQREKKQKGQVAPKLYSAGVLFAESHPQGVHAVTVAFEDGTYWVIASHDGAVIAGTDVLCVTHDDAVAVIGEVAKRYSGLLLADPSKLKLDETKKPRTALLQPIKTSVESVPRWVKVAAVVFGIFILIDQGSARWKRYQLEKEQGDHVEQYVDAATEWKKTLDQWQKGVRLDGQAGLSFLFAEVGRVPMAIGGWDLFSVDCKATVTGWACDAVYNRSALGDNSSFLASKPNDKQVIWQGLGKAQLHWTAVFDRPQLDRLEIPLTQFMDAIYFSSVQAVWPAFKQVSIANRATAPVQPPVVTNAQGESRAVPLPAQENKFTHVPGVQHFKFEGPLRSLAVLPMTDTAVLKSISVRVADRTDPTLINSVLRVDSLEGDMYVQ